MLIRDLNGAGVASIEYIEVGRALYYGNDVPDTIAFYNDALTAPPNVAYTHALARGFLADVYYQLGRNAIAHEDYMLAAEIISKHALLARAALANDIAQWYLSDAYPQMLINGCRIAVADMAAARRALGSYTENLTNQTLQASDVNEYPLKCNGTG